MFDSFASKTDQKLLKSANYLTPFLPSLQDSIHGFKKILSGEMDNMPEVAFYMVGDIDDVVAKANRLADESS